MGILLGTPPDTFLCTSWWGELGLRIPGVGTGTGAGRSVSLLPLIRCADVSHLPRGQHLLQRRRDCGRQVWAEVAFDKQVAVTVYQDRHLRRTVSDRVLQ